MPNKQRELRKERRCDLKMGRFSLRSDARRVWRSRWVGATLWGVGGVLEPKNQRLETRPVAYPLLTRVMQAAPLSA